MKLLAPANSKETLDRALWFKNPVARKLNQKKNVEFGFELKGKPENIEDAQPIFWGYHLPGYFATEWYYHPEKRKDLILEINKIAKLKPDYVVMHGIHLLWQPPIKEYIQRYANYSDSKEYFKILDSSIELINQLKKIIPLKIENFPLYNYYDDNGQILPYTYLFSGVGRLNDLFYLKEKTGVDILIDIEHLEVILNFLNRKKNYRDLPREKDITFTEDEIRLKKIFGYVLKKDVIPYVEEEIKLEDIIEKIRAKFYHLTGSFQDVISGKKVTSHGPIDYQDKRFRRILRTVLRQNPEVLVLETADSSIGNAWKHLRKNEIELSFYNLCKILLEEL